MNIEKLFLSLVLVTAIFSNFQNRFEKDLATHCKIMIDETAEI